MLQNYPDLEMKRLIWKDVELLQQLAEKNKYNRQIDLTKLKKEVKKQVKSMGYEDFDSIYFAAKALMIHEHKGGNKCEEHMRSAIYFPEVGNVTLDCDIHVWNSLENIHPTFDKEPKPRPKLKVIQGSKE
jgi:hypothetical protein